MKSKPIESNGSIRVQIGVNEAMIDDFVVCPSCSRVSRKPLWCLCVACCAVVARAGCRVAAGTPSARRMALLSPGLLRAPAPTSAQCWQSGGAPGNRDRGPSRCAAHLRRRRPRPPSLCRFWRATVRRTPRRHASDDRSSRRAAAARHWLGRVGAGAGAGGAANGSPRPHAAPWRWTAAGRT